MKEIIKLNENDKNKQFIIIDKYYKRNIISEYIGFYQENINLTYKFRLSYLQNLQIYINYYMKEIQNDYIVQEIKLPFERVCKDTLFFNSSK